MGYASSAILKTGKAVNTGDIMARAIPYPLETKDPMQSPCVRNCCLDLQDICLGCGRSLAEIRDWSNMNEAQRKAVLEQASARKGSANPFI